VELRQAISVADRVFTYRCLSPTTPMPTSSPDLQVYRRPAPVLEGVRTPMKLCSRPLFSPTACYMSSTPWSTWRQLGACITPDPSTDKRCYSFFRIAYAVLLLAGCAALAIWGDGLGIPFCS